MTAFLYVKLQLLLAAFCFLWFHVFFKKLFHCTIKIILVILIQESMSFIIFNHIFHFDTSAFSMPQPSGHFLPYSPSDRLLPGQ